MAARTVLPELARDSHLVTRMTSDYCVHFFAETPTVTRKEVWKRTKRIGAGGFGTVWLEKCIEGQESGNDKYRAVKVLRLPSSAQAQDAIAQCGRELEALAKFSQRKYSRCFVKSYGWYEHASSVSICLEYLPLGDLQAFIAKRADSKLPEPEAQQIISQVLDGLVFMHAEGFAHRDLKPANILIKSYGPDNWWVKLSDFGLSKRTEVTRSATALQGTPGFMAPELWGFLPDDHKSGIVMWCSADLWCLGEIAFQLVTGKATFLNPGALAKYARGESEFPVSELQKAMVSPAMVDFVTATMLADYSQRPTAEIASTHRWLRELKTVSLVLPSHVRFGSTQELSSGESSVFDYTASSIEYRDWSTITSVPEVSLQGIAGVDPPLPRRGTVNAVIPINKNATTPKNPSSDFDTILRNIGPIPYQEKGKIGRERSSRYYDRNAKPVTDTVHAPYLPGKGSAFIAQTLSESAQKHPWAGFSRKKVVTWVRHLSIFRAQSRLRLENLLVVPLVGSDVFVVTVINPVNGDKRWYEISKSHWDRVMKKVRGFATVRHGISRIMPGVYDRFAQPSMNRRLHYFEVSEANFMEAQNIWIKGDQTRAHPFYAACLYKIGAYCLDQGKVEAAIKHLRDSLEIMKVHRADRPVEHARSLFKLPEALLQHNMDTSHAEAITLRDEVENVLRKANSTIIRFDTESVYDDLVPIFWR
ncbi:hypothetical protein CIB48_g7180 [Xylaria polymorpha]|nr:hypothetical protein CIB48_g7180 [Xylaria polymorpha]